jgi:hypothetical protein
MLCSYCGSTELRLSRFRRGDLVKLVFLKRPVRCRLCSKRTYANLLAGWRIGQDDKARHQTQSQRKSQEAKLG